MNSTNPVSPKVTIPVFDDLDSLFSSGFGSCREFFFSDNKDWSKVIVMFNGAVAASQRLNGFGFQRWTWAKQFKHPVIIIADPATFGDDGLALGWYVGLRGSYYLPSALETILPFIKKRNQAAEVVTFGSSAGGFTALAALQLGYADIAIAINPQTDVEKYTLQSAVRSMLRKYSHGDTYVSQPEDRERLSLISMGFDRAKKSARIIYAQNSADTHHYEDHMTPYLGFVKKSELSDRCISVVFNDEKQGHNPPPLNGLVNLIGHDIQRLLASDE